MLRVPVAFLDILDFWGISKFTCLYDIMPELLTLYTVLSQFYPLFIYVEKHIRHSHGQQKLHIELLSYVLSQPIYRKQINISLKFNTPSQIVAIAGNFRKSFVNLSAESFRWGHMLAYDFNWFYLSSAWRWFIHIFTETYVKQMKRAFDLFNFWTLFLNNAIRRALLTRSLQLVTT